MCEDVQGDCPRSSGRGRISLFRLGAAGVIDAARVHPAAGMPSKFARCRPTFSFYHSDCNLADGRSSPRQTYRVGQKTGPFLKVCLTPVYDDVGRRSIYQNLQLFIRSKKRHYTENTSCSVYGFKILLLHAVCAKNALENAVYKRKNSKIFWGKSQTETTL